MSDKDQISKEACFERCTQNVPPVRNVTHPLRYYEFTQDELKALEECDTESFYRRCLPISAAFAALTYTAVQRGKLKRNPYFGAVPKVMFAIILGHVIGRLMYAPIADEKLRTTLPEDSHLGQLLQEYYLEHNPPPSQSKK